MYVEGNFSLSDEEERDANQVLPRTNDTGDRAARGAGGSAAVARSRRPDADPRRQDGARARRESAAAAAVSSEPARRARPGGGPQPPGRAPAAGSAARSTRRARRPPAQRGPGRGLRGSEQSEPALLVLSARLDRVRAEPVHAPLSRVER